jgi:DNA polymerase/3'-5' exonuclease PolX
MKIRIRRRDGVVQAYHVADEVVNKLKPYSKKIIVAGSIRRKKIPNDVDIVIIPKDSEAIRKEIEKLGTIKSAGSQQITSKIKGIDVDIFFSKPNEFGAQLLTRTGSAGHNIGLRQIAQSQGKILSQHGLFDKKTGKRLAGMTEREIYAELKRPIFTKPEDR